jgi:phosphopantothenoylcysteine synthetase/decarboxylase
MFKKSTTILIIATTILTSCTSLSRTGNVKAYIPGIYVRLVSNEFSIGRDTLIISELSKVGNSYRIIKKTAFQRIAEGKTSKVERKQEVWNAVYNEQEKLLHETVKGKLLSFNPEARLLYVGTSEYKKISE